MALTLTQLTLIAGDFLLKEYGLALTIPIQRNNRLKRALGAFVYNKDRDTGECTPLYIELAGDLFVYADESVLIDTLKHECVHYAFFTLGRPHRDGQPEFESELKRLGIGATNAINVGVVYESDCSKCGNKDVDWRKAKYPMHQYRSNCCNAPMTEQIKRIYNGTEAV